MSLVLDKDVPNLRFGEQISNLISADRKNFNFPMLDVHENDDSIH